MTVPNALIQLNQARTAVENAKAELANAIAALNQFVADDGTLDAFDADDIDPGNANDFLATVDIGSAIDRVTTARANVDMAVQNVAHLLQVARNQGLV